LSETHVFGPAWLNEGRFGFVRVYYGNQPPFTNEAPSASLGIPNANTSPLLGGGALIGGSNSQIEYSGDFGPLMVAHNTFQFSDIVSHAVGKHTVRFGATVIRRQVNSFRPNRGKGFFFLNPSGIGAGSTGYEPADLLVGFVNNYSIGTSTGMLGVRTLESSFFAQDSWRVTPKLTVDVGLRYDLYTNPAEVLDRQSDFDITTGHILLAGSDGNSRSFVPLDKTNFGPRVGFAYSLGNSGKTVLRGGYGMFFTIEGGGVNYQLTQNPPFGGYRQFNYSDGYRITLSGQAPMGSADSRLATGRCRLGILAGSI
jgi:outer membrane receptor protein involved in Fe transport